MRIFKLAILTIGAIFAANIGTASAADKITIASEAAYAPFSYLDKEGNLVGFDIDIVKALCGKMKTDCIFVNQEWDGLIPGLIANKFDAIAASMSITEERLKKVGFTDQYHSTSAVITARKDAKITLDSNGLPDKANLKGLKIGVLTSSVYETYANENFKSIGLKSYDTSDNANLDLMNGRIDARFEDVLISREGILKADGGDRFMIFGKGFTGGALGEGAGIALRKEDAKLTAAFNKALKEILADGTYKKINDKYFDFDIYKF